MEPRRLNNATSLSQINKEAKPRGLLAAYDGTKKASLNRPTGSCTWRWIDLSHVKNCQGLV